MNHSNCYKGKTVGEGVYLQNIQRLFFLEGKNPEPDMPLGYPLPQQVYSVCFILKYNRISLHRTIYA